MELCIADHRFLITQYTQQDYSWNNYLNLSAWSYSCTTSDGQYIINIPSPQVHLNLTLRGSFEDAGFINNFLNTPENGPAITMEDEDLIYHLVNCRMRELRLFSQYNEESNIILELVCDRCEYHRKPKLRGGWFNN